MGNLIRDDQARHRHARARLARNGYLTGQTINVNGGWYMS